MTKKIFIVQVGQIFKSQATCWKSWSPRMCDLTFPSKLPKQNLDHESYFQWLGEAEETSSPEQDIHLPASHLSLQTIREN